MREAIISGLLDYQGTESKQYSFRPHEANQRKSQIERVRKDYKISVTETEAEEEEEEEE